MRSVAHTPKHLLPTKEYDCERVGSMAAGGWEHEACPTDAGPPAPPMFNALVLEPQVMKLSPMNYIFH